MAPTSRLLATRLVATGAVVLVALLLVAACGGDTSSSTRTSATVSFGASPVPASPVTTSNPSPTSVLASGTGGEVRSGCGSYCQSAGGYGAPGAQGVTAVTVVSTGVTADPDGFVPVKLTCNLPVQCGGAIQICLAASGGSTGMAMGCGRTDEALHAGATQTVGVPMPTPALGFLRSNGPTSASLIVDNSQVPDCQQIPQLAVQCAQTVEAQPADHPRGDGIIRLISADLTIVPAPPSADSPASESASFRKLQQAAAADREFVLSQLADRWVPQLSSKRTGVVDDGFTWDNTLTWQEFVRLQLRYGAKLLWSGDWSTFDASDTWVTIEPITFGDAHGALEWCSTQGFDADHCAAKLVSTTHPVAGSFAHN